MPRRAKGPRLWFRDVRRDAAGNLTHAGARFVLDGASQIGTGLGEGATADEKEGALSAYLVTKHGAAARSGSRDPANIPIDDVLALYITDKVSKHAEPDKTDSRIGFLSAFWSGKMLSEVTGQTCREYARQRPAQAARREFVPQEQRENKSRASRYKSRRTRNDGAAIGTAPDAGMHRTGRPGGAGDGATPRAGGRPKRDHARGDRQPRLRGIRERGRLGEAEVAVRLPILPVGAPMPARRAPRFPSIHHRSRPGQRGGE